MAGGSFLAILRIAGFFASVWSVGKVAKFIGVSSIVFEITIGLVLSPSIGGLLPAAYSECTAKSLYDCSTTAAFSSIADSGHQLTEMLHHMHEAGLGGCISERKKFDEAYPAYAFSGSAGSSSGSDRRLGGVASGDYPFSGSEVAEVLEKCIVKDCEKEVAHLCQAEPNFFTMVGHAGVSMMIFESGMHFDFEKAIVVGPWACVVAVLGTLLPLGAGMLLIYLFNEPLYPDGLAAGVSLAPTSVGIALRLLLEAKQLQKDFGQAIITAAFVDDILSLVAFNVLFSATSGQFSFVSSILPALIGMVFLIIGASLGIKFWPWVVKEVTSRVIAKKGAASLSRQDEVLLLMMFALLLAYATFTFYLGTHLWGCFVAGMSFAMVSHAHHVWVRQVKRSTVWLLRIFFSCTVAFAIPFDNLLSLEAFWKGSILGIFACVATKVFCAFFMGESRFVIGWAMVGRAEFAYLIAEMAKSSGIMSPKVFAIVIWSLLYATILAPFCFRKVLGRYAAKLAARGENDEEQEAGEDGLKRSPSKGIMEELQHRTSAGHGYTHMDGQTWAPGDLNSFAFQVTYPRRGTSCNVEDTLEIWNLLHKHGFMITKSSQICDQETHLSEFQLQAEDGNALEASELAFVQEEICRELQGLSAHVLFLPSLYGTESKCKLAKVTVVADMSIANQSKAGSMKSLGTIVEAVKSKDFYVIRAGIEVHGSTAIVKFLIAHKGDDTEERTGKVSYGSMMQGGNDVKPSKSMGKLMADGDLDHLRVGPAGLPDILPAQLTGLKATVEAMALPDIQRISTYIEPLTYGQGALGDTMHDAMTLLNMQDDLEKAFEIKIIPEPLPKELFPEVMRCLRSFKVNLISSKLDERSARPIAIIVIPEIDSQTLEKDILDALSKIAKKMGVEGRIEIGGLSQESQVRHSRDIGRANTLVRRASGMKSVGVLDEETRMRFNSPKSGAAKKPKTMSI